MGGKSSKIDFRRRKSGRNSSELLDCENIDGIKFSESSNHISNNQSGRKSSGTPSNISWDSTTSHNSDDTGIAFSCRPREYPVSTIHENEVFDLNVSEHPNVEHASKDKQDMSERTVSVGSKTSDKVVLPVLSPKDIHRFKNKKAVDEVIPFLLGKILHWSSPDKLPTETFLQYMERKNISCRRLSPWEQQKLSKTSSPEGFDAVPLYSLIRMIGYNPTSSTNSVWQEKSKCELESLLSEMKNIRNGNAHDVKTEATSPEVLNRIETISDQIILLASSVYSLKPAEIEEEKATLAVKIKEVKESIITDQEKYSIQLHNQLRIESRKSLTDFCNMFCTESILYLCDYRASLPKVFSPSKLCSKGPKAAADALKVDLYKLLSEESSINPFNDIIVLEGDAGSGKTTILKMLIHDFLDESSHKFEKLENFEFVYYISCREHSIFTLQDFIRATYPHLSTQYKVKDLENEIFDSSNLFIFDGLDELDEDSIAIVEKWMKQTARSGKSTFLIAVRPFFTQYIHQKADLLGSRYRTFSVRKIEPGSEQSLFLKKYENELGTKNTEICGLVDAFEQIDQNLKPFFNRPITLILFCSMYGKSTKEICKWSLESEINKEVIALYKELLDERFRSKRIINSEILIDEFIEEICILAVRCIHKNTLSFTAEDCSHFKATSHEPQSENSLPIHDCLSTIFSSGPQSSGTEVFQSYTYQFSHRDFQEFMASRALFHRVKTQKSLIGMLEEVIGEPILLKDGVKFRNVFAWVLTILVDKEVRKKCAKDVSRFLREADQDELAFWNTALSKCGYHEDIVRLAAETLDVKEWCVNLTTWKTALHLLSIKHPWQIKVELRAEDPIPDEIGSFFKMIQNLNFKGELAVDLRSSYAKMIPVDEILENLHGSQCSLTRFTGCVSFRGCSRLAPLLSKHSTVIIALHQPALHNLHLLPADNLSVLEVAVPYSDSAEEIAQLRPLPDTELKLVIRDVPSGAVKWTRNALCALAPPSRGLGEIFLERTGLTDDDLSVVTAQFPTAKRALMSGELTSADNFSWTVERYHGDDTRNIRLRLGPR